MGVEDFSDLTKVDNAKLMKLRDIATDYARETNEEAQKAMQRLRDILGELDRRKDV